MEQLRARNTTPEDPMVIEIHVTFITVDELKPASVAIKTVGNEKLNWRVVTAPLLEEVHMLRSDQRQS